MAHRNCWFTLLKMVIFYSDVNVYQRVLGPILRQGTHTVFFHVPFRKNTDKTWKQCFQIVQIVQYFIHFILFFFSRMIITRTHTTKIDMVKDQLLFRHGFQQDGPFPLHIGPAASVCVGGCLADLAGELEELKCLFFFSAGFSAQVLFWKACGLGDPPQYKDKDSGAKVECCLARPWFIENPPSERDCKKKNT